VTSKLERLGLILFGAGVALLTEHIINFGASFTYPPYLDHGLYGLIMIIISFIILARRSGDDARPEQANLNAISGAPRQPSRGDA